MVDEMGADLNGFTANDSTPLHFAYHIDILQDFLARGADPARLNWGRFAFHIDILQDFLARGADPARLNWGRYTPFNCHVCNGNVEAAVYLLQDSRVRATINVESSDGEIPLHRIACELGDDGAAFMASHLLQAGANPNLKDREGRTPLAKVQEKHPNHQATIALSEQTPDAEKTSLLVKARRLLVAATNTAMVPSYLEGRMARDEPLPEVVVAPLPAGHTDKEEGRKFHTVLAFMLGMEGEGERMPRDVFRVVLDMLMPAWDPLRRGVPGMELLLSDQDCVYREAPEQGCIEAMIYFTGMTEEELRQWVEANPVRLNDEYDEDGRSPLFVAACYIKSLPLVVWMLDEKGADRKGTTRNGSTPLHSARSTKILDAFLDRGADPARLNCLGYTPLSCQICHEKVDSAIHLLQDPRVRATIDVQSRDGETALHHCACHCRDPEAAFMASHLLQAGANPKIKDENGRTPLAKVQKEHRFYRATIAILDQASKEAGKTSLLVKARRLVVVAASSAVVPSYLQGRVVRDQPLPRVTLNPLMGDQNDGQNDDERELLTLLASMFGQNDDKRELRTLLVFMLGMEGGPEGEGMPRDVFRLVMDMLMLAWDPLRRGVVDMEMQLQG